MSSTIETIKAKIDLVEEISQVVALKKSGNSFKGNCPFHDERTPSFYVFPQTQTWRCFGCNRGGDVFTFVREHQGTDFSEALSYLAGKAGVALEARAMGDPEEARARREARARLATLNELAALWFHQHLLHSPEAAGARDYVRERGITPDSVQHFLLGYAPDRRDALLRYLTAQGYTEQELIDGGLVRERVEDGPGERRSVFDFFRHRLIFPIRDIKGQIVGFGGRALGDVRPKYLNTPQTLLFEKNSLLYGIDQARDGIKQQGQVIIVEGYVDALVAQQYGTQQTIACIGSAITEQHIQILKRLTRQITLALDPDAAGNQATEQGIAVALKAADRKLVPVPLPAEQSERWQSKKQGQQPGGMIRLEEQADIEINVLQLPQGEDPDEFIRRDLSGWRYAVKHPIPLVDYYFQVKSANLNLRDPQGRSEAARRLLPVIAAISDRIKRDAYVRKLAGMINMPEKTLHEELARELKGRSATVLGEVRGNSNGSVKLQGERTKYEGGINRQGEREKKLDNGAWSTLQWEDYLNGLLIQNPGLSQHVCGIISDGDFSGTDTRELYRILNSTAQRASSPSELTIDTFVPPSLQEAASRAVKCVVESTTPKDGEGLVRDAVQCATRLKIAHLRQLNTHYEFLMEEAARNGDKTFERQLRQLIAQLLREIRTIDTAMRLHN